MLFRNICYTAPFIIMVMSVIVIIAWFLKVDFLLTIIPGAVPMQFNTALCFFLCSVSLALMTHRKEYQPYAIAVQFPAGLIGFLTLYQYASGTDLGIDQLFMNHHLTDQTVSPGRMAPNTALCFSMAVTYLVCFGRNAIALIIASLIMSFGAAAFFGYLLSIKGLFTWGYIYTSMAAHTAFGFLILGLSYLLCIRKYF